MKLLFDLIDINKIAFKFLADFKLILIVNGLQTATSTYPCPYCFISLSELRSKKNKVCSSNTEGKVLRTYGAIKNDFENFKANGQNKKKATNFHSTVNPPIFEEKEDMAVLQKCIIPELHVLQGFVNHAFWDGLLPILGRETALKWPQKLGLISKGYHGEIFEGNACRKMLKESDRLMQPDICGNLETKLKILPFVNIFKAMDKIVSCSFSSRKVSNDLNLQVENLTKLYEATGLSVTLKIHVIFEHLVKCVSFLNSPLGPCSEQPGETVHSEFIKFWKNFKINDTKSEDYLINLKKAVVQFSSQHI